MSAPHCDYRTAEKSHTSGDERPNKNDDSHRNPADCRGSPSQELVHGDHCGHQYTYIYNRRQDESQRRPPQHRKQVRPEPGHRLV